MTENTLAESGNPEPGPDNFDFEAWLDEESSFPKFKHTAYVNQEAGAEYGALSEELDELLTSRINLDRQVEERTKASANSFVDAALDRLTDERDRVDSEIEEIQEKLGELAKQIRDSAITLTFQVKTPEELGTVTREATRRFHKENTKFKNIDENDLDYVTARSRYMLTAQIAHFCIGMFVHRTKRDVAPPTQQGADKLMSKLISSEMMRLMEKMGQGLSDSRDWATKIDAGFPGGGAHMEEVRLAEAGPEDSAPVGSSTPDDADWPRVELG